MATQTCCAGEAPVVHHNASFEADDSVSAKIALDNNQLSGTAFPALSVTAPLSGAYSKRCGSWRQPTPRFWSRGKQEQARN